MSTSHRRRPRADLDSDDEASADRLRISQRSTPSASDSIKRPRTSQYPSESPAPESSRTNGFIQAHNTGEDDGQESDDEDPGRSEHQPGAIVRVKLKNFITYKEAEFYPGPNLNMVIGPNGTGKSSVVCAICLGLGWAPKTLGRSEDITDFVKYGSDHAEVEIELKKRPSDEDNHVIRLKIMKDGSPKEWWLNGKKTSNKAVTALMKSLSIQVDNLCQFLPQDKVAAFAALSPVDLLTSTQRAAAPEEMLAQHTELKRLFAAQKAHGENRARDQETLDNLEHRQQSLHAEVMQLQDKRKILKKIEVLEKTIPYVEYQTAVAQHKIFAARKKTAQENLKSLEERLAPILQSVNMKEQYRDQLSVVVNERKKAVEAAERQADQFIKADEELTGEIESKIAALEAEQSKNQGRKDEVRKLQRKIADLKANLNNNPIEFDPREYNERVRVKEHAVRDIRQELAEAKEQLKEIKEQGLKLRQEKETAELELREFDSQEGQQMNKLAGVSKEVAKAWEWIQKNQNVFEHEVYGPPVISCSIKDPRFVDAVESLIGKSDFLCITAQNDHDLKILTDQLHEKMGLGEITLRTNDQQPPHDRPLSQQDMQRYGMDGWAIDFIDGPGPVLSMLCDSAKVSKSAISLKDTTEEQYEMIMREGKLQRWVTSTHTYVISRRAEYGPSATSTTAKALRAATYWTDGPVDTSARQEIENRLKARIDDFAPLKAKNESLRSTIGKLQEKGKNLNDEIKEIKDEKNALQTAANDQKALPDKIRREEDALAEKVQARLEAEQNNKRIGIQYDLAVLRKAEIASQLKDQVSKLRACLEELVEAKIRLIEAESDVAGLEARNIDVVRRLQQERESLATIELEAGRVKQDAKKALALVRELNADPDNAPYIEGWGKLDGLTIEDLNNDIAMEQANLDNIQASNPHAIEQYEQRQAVVEQLKEKIHAVDAKLEKNTRKITAIRSEWEPKLDALVAEINEAFAYNFEQIKCAGEVSIHKDEDFSLWAIQIKVKFRESEMLHILDSQRQSGGEKSVSTIFYLLALQSLATAPFRVVDEINQGMDARNERMVHGRMVEIACHEGKSQYFLITPKLLTGLRYDERMKVLCIASGEHMPSNYKRLDVAKIIGIKRHMIAAG